MRKACPGKRLGYLCGTPFAYTNHTLLPEALETWAESLFGKVLPRHLQLVQEINRRFQEEIRARFPGDEDRVHRMSIVADGQVRMAYLSVVASQSVNGVSRITHPIAQTETDE